MRAISYTRARAELAKTMDQVRDDCEPVIITRGRGPAFVLMTLEQYESLDETAYLLRSPANAQRLRQAVEELEAGHGVVRELDLDA
jgi:antitoxin YefM